MQCRFYLKTSAQSGDAYIVFTNINYIIKRVPGVYVHGNTILINDSLRERPICNPKLYFPLLKVLFVRSLHCFS